jgi:hypothetical protein
LDDFFECFFQGSKRSRHANDGSWGIIWGLGFGVWGLGFGVWGLGFGVWGLGFGVWGLGFGVESVKDGEQPPAATPPAQQHLAQNAPIDSTATPVNTPKKDTV